MGDHVALVKGSVSVAGGVATGTGFAFQMYQAMESRTDFMGASTAAQQKAKSQLAVIANAAAEMIDHVKSAAVVSTTDVGVAPTAPIQWTGTGTGTVT